MILTETMNDSVIDNPVPVLLNNLCNPGVKPT